ncbi:hypothetical protein EBN88_06850 [Streptomyces triticirhizae]|uniref:Uncharacterized protein n=1 Tax=Streptomyces triticirhizae TaxID=2483353 RepID=A0A3M2M1L2_9ACTN|nr:hypothetical protein EBN88_06850 [Streptomyces triticirhizae]
MGSVGADRVSPTSTRDGGWTVSTGGDTMGKHEKPDHDNESGDALPGKPFEPAPPSPDGGAPEGSGEHRK